ncbi:hypothetical protein LNQ03_00835 [Klebsiella pneumoniae subsp. pneumoniae]|nr:hypothetical protein [Klebsiella pneumoniae subsp. pneumoniae]
MAAAPLPGPTGSTGDLRLPRPGKRCAGGQSIGHTRHFAGGGYALPGLQGLQAIFASQAR